jgi:transposase
MSAWERFAANWLDYTRGLDRPSIAPERLLRALLLQMLYGIRSERLLMEQLQYNFLFGWFIGLNLEDRVWDATVFSMNRDRLLEGDVARWFFQAVLEQMRKQGLPSDEHFSVDGTLIEAWASEKSLQRRQDPPAGGRGARGKMLLHDLFDSRTDPEARKFKKIRYGDAKRSDLIHVLMDNRHGAVFNCCVTAATTGAERKAAIQILRIWTENAAAPPWALTKASMVRGFVSEVRQRGVTPHVAQFERRTFSLDRRTLVISAIDEAWAGARGLSRSSVG